MSKKMKTLRALTKEELQSKMVELKSKLSVLKGKVKSNIRPEKPGEIRSTRRDIARMLTLLNTQKFSQTLGGGQKSK